MAIRDDLNVEYTTDPRIVEVSAPSKEITMQDMVSTLRVEETSFKAMGWEKLINASGKEDLGGEVRVGITAALQNALLAFEARTTAAETGTVTGAPASPIASQQVFQDNAALFEDAKILRGSLVINFSDKSIADVVTVNSQTELVTRLLVNGTTNTYQIDDDYQVFNIVQCKATGGNLVSVDELQETIDAILPTAFTQVVVTSSSSATFSESTAIQYSSYGGGVTIDIPNGSPGTTFPSGTIEQPVNNVTDAVTIAQSRGFNKLFILGNLTLKDADDVDDFTIEGETINKSTITIEDSASVVNTEFYSATVTGILDGGNSLNGCAAGNLTYVNGTMIGCALYGTIILAGGADASFINCSMWNPTLPPVIDMGDTGQSCNFTNWSGKVSVENLSSATENFELQTGGGEITLDPTITAGNFRFDGIGVYVNNAAATTSFIVDGLLNRELIADNVWDDIVADHQGAGTYGHELATKADIASAAATTEVFANSGSVIEGTDTDGDYTYLASKDSDYWQITEHVDDGITVELIYTLPSENHRPGAISVFGRYTGQPAGTHFQNLWAYNYETAGWESLIAEFMPGGNTSDANYVHEFFERHIDRDNNHEVKIRIIHNPTTYNDSHNLYIDFVCITGIEVISAADIADAVWDEVLSGTSHNDPSSAGRRLRAVFGGVITEGTAASAGNNYIELNSNASTQDGAYDPALISIVGGPGAGQSRGIYEYIGSSKTAYIDRNWKMNPTDESEYIISAWPGREHVNEGIAQAGTSSTIKLNTLASGDDNAYVGQLIFVRSGIGEDQVRVVRSYNGTSKIATLNRNWDVTPNGSSVYVMLPAHAHEPGDVWEEAKADHDTVGSTGEALNDIYDQVYRLIYAEENDVLIHDNGDGTKTVTVYTIAGPPNVFKQYTIEIDGDDETRTPI